MTFSRIVVDKKTGKASEEPMPSNFKHESDEQVARRKLMEKERTRRQPFDALTPKEQANHPTPNKGVHQIEGNDEDDPEPAEVEQVQDPAPDEPEVEEDPEDAEEADGDEGDADEDEDTPDDEEE